MRPAPATGVQMSRPPGCEKDPESTRLPSVVVWRVLLRACVLALAACSGITTTVEPGSSTDLGVFETYAWADASPPDDALAGRIRAAVDAELAAMGIAEVDRAAAHLLVSQQTSIESKARSTDPYFVLGPVEKYEEGTLVLDFVDARTRERVWRGQAQTRLRDVARSVGVHSQRFEATSEERDWRVDETVRAILDEYPGRRPPSPRRDG